jgi:hypothetical protein
MKLKEHDLGVLAEDLTAHGLKKGDVGAAAGRGHRRATCAHA